MLYMPCTRRLQGVWRGMVALDIILFALYHLSSKRRLDASGSLVWANHIPARPATRSLLKVNLHQHTDNRARFHSGLLTLLLCCVPSRGPKSCSPRNLDTYVTCPPQAGQAGLASSYTLTSMQQITGYELNPNILAQSPRQAEPRSPTIHDTDRPLVCYQRFRSSAHPLMPSATSRHRPLLLHSV